MTLEEYYREARRELRAVPVEAPDAEALRLCEHFFGFRGRAALIMRGGEVPKPDIAEAFERALAQRRSRPLQYILGEWEFCGIPFRVGEGVLCPREDTETLVEAVCAGLESIKGEKRGEKKVLDLCSGSGAVGIAVADRIPDARCVCVELSPDAAKYLDENIRLFGDGRVTRMMADVLAPPPPELADLRFDAVCCNPPYIRTGEIAGLSREIHQEPYMALDGGEDGMKFYRALAVHWLSLLKEGGRLSVELGEGESAEAEEIFTAAGLTDIGHINDISGTIRTIYGTKPANN